MELTVKILKRILSDLPDDVVLADLELGNDKFSKFSHVKRLLVLKDTSPDKNLGGKTYLVINKMGSHFSNQGDQAGLTYQKFYDEDNLPSVQSDKTAKPFSPACGDDFDVCCLNSDAECCFRFLESESRSWVLEDPSICDNCVYNPLNQLNKKKWKYVDLHYPKVGKY